MNLDNRIPRAGARLLVALVVLSASVLSASPARDFSKPVRLYSDAAWSWWTQPLVDLSAGKLRFTGVTSAGAQRVLTWWGPSLSYSNVGNARPDEHNAPAISAAPGQPTLTAYTAHPGQLYFRTAPEGTTSFGPARAIRIPGRTTYVQLLRRGSRVVLLTRSTSAGWYSISSRDGGRTWGPAHLLFDATGLGQPYLWVRPFDRDASTFHVTAYRNPAGSTANPIRYRTLTFDQMFSGSVTFRHAAMSSIWRPTSASYRLRLLDVADKHRRPMVLYARWNRRTTVPQYYVAVRTAAGWNSTKIGSSGGTLYRFVNKYVGGMSFDRRPGVARVYVVNKGIRVWKLTTYRLTPSGNAYSGVRLASSFKPVARPVQVGEGVAYLRFDHYSHFRSFRGQVWYIARVAR